MSHLRRIASVIVLALLLALPYVSFYEPASRLILNVYSNPIAGPWFYAFIAHPSQNIIELKGLKAPVHVLVDSRGVPHIFAEYEEDAFYALGWIQASQRFWQMDLLRRIGSGNLSALLGEAALDIDIFMRSLGYHIVAEKSLNLVKELAAKGDKLASKALRALEAYTKGVNEWLVWAKRTGRIPIEYRILGIEPEPWKPTDSMKVALVIIHGLAFTQSDILISTLINSTEDGWILPLLLELRDWLVERNATIILGDSWRSYTRIAQGLEFKGLEYVTFSSKVEVTRTNTSHALRELIPYLRALARLTPLNIIPGFSNNWVVSGKLTETGKPILANDPHLELTVPPIWYEYHVVARDTGLNMYGVGFPGIPFIIIGQNEYVAVGYTNSMIDVVDFYFYKWKDNVTYYYKGKWLKANERKEVFKVYDLRGGHIVFKKTVLETVHGPVLEIPIGNKTVKLAVQSTTLIASPILVWAYAIMHARSVYDVLKAQQYFYAPIQNAIAADVYGNIMYSPTGLIPVRENKPVIIVETSWGKVSIVNEGFLPFNGSLGEGEWEGFIPFSEIPRLLNPEKGYIVTANNLIVDPRQYPYYLQFLVCDRYRYERIVELITQLLSEKGKLDVEDFKRIQTDVGSLAARSIIKLLGPLVYSKLPELETWDYTMDPNDYRPTIAFAFLKTLHELLWSKLFKKRGLKPNYGCGGLRLELTEFVIWKAVEGDTKYLKQLGFNSLEELVDKALSETMEELASIFGTRNPHEWIWGLKHRYKIEHVLGRVLSWLNYPSYPAPGDPYTVNPSPEYEIGEGVKHGPSVRFIANLEMGSFGFIQLPGGNDGNPFSLFYSNQLPGWVKGEYHSYSLERKPEELIKRLNIVSIITFKPGGG